MVGAVWTDTDASTKYGVAIYNFQSSGPNTLELHIGDAVCLVQQLGGWYFGYCIKNRTQKGIFPKNYVHVKEAIIDKTGSYETVIPKEPPIVQEITAVLREWGLLWKKLYLEPKSALGNAEYELIYQLMLELIDQRSLVLLRQLTVDELRDIQQKVTSKIDAGNARLGLDLVVRDDRGNIIDPLKTSTISLFRQHQLSTKRIEQERELTLDRAHPKKVTCFNLFVNVKNFVCRIGENADIVVSLYDSKDGNFISENYVMKWGTQGMPKDLDMLNNLRVLFSDLSVKDASRDKVYLVCQIIRIGRMDLKEQESKKQAKGMRRPFGVATIEVTDLLKGSQDADEEKQYFIPFLQCGDRDFMDSIIRKSIIAKDINHKGQGLWVTMRKLMGDPAQVKLEYPHLVTSLTAVARKMGFPDVIMPGDVRNDFYVTIMQGEFRKGTKVGDRNIEVVMAVCNKDGEIIPDVISEGAGGEKISQYKCIIYYHEDKPRWYETVKLDIPIQEFQGCHLKFTMRHRPSAEAKDKVEKPFAMSFIRLMNDEGTTLGDTTHDLLVYKIDSKKGDESCKTYLTLPSSQAELSHPKFGYTAGTPLKNVQLSSSSSLQLNTSDSFQIHTLVCSTKLTHNVNLMSLLKWRDNEASLDKHLRSFLSVDGEEIVKFLQDTLDALFNILMENPNSDLYDSLVFDALMFILVTISDRKYNQFKPVLDVYIKENFSATLAYSKLVLALKCCVESKDDKSALSLLKAMRSLEYIFKFIVRSRILFAELNENQGKPQFDESLQKLFGSICQLMKDSRENILPSLEACLQYMSAIVADVILVYNPLEFSKLMVEFINSIPRDRLDKQKLQYFSNLVHSHLFLLPDCRRILLPVMLTHIEMQMSRQIELELCVRTMSDIMDLLFNTEKVIELELCVRTTSVIMDLLFNTEKVGPTNEDITNVSRIMLRTVVQTVVLTDKRASIIPNCVAVMTSILRQMSEFHYNLYIGDFETSIDLMDFLLEILMTIENLVKDNVFPSDWCEMIMLQNWVFLKSLRLFSNTVRDKFTNPFFYDVWNRYFHSAIAFLTQDPLQLNLFSTSKRSKIVNRYRDMRRDAGADIRSMWYNLGQHKVEFIPDIVGPILEMTLIPETELRRSTIPVFFDMMQCEFMSIGPTRHHKRSFGKNIVGVVFQKFHSSLNSFNPNYALEHRTHSFDSELITQLDALVCSNHGDENYQEMFYEIIKGLFNDHTTMKDQGIEFVEKIRRLMQLLLEYREVALEDNRDNKMSCTVGLLNFYHDIHRSDLYICYLDKLCILHIECDNFTEAAYTLLLYTKLLRWSDDVLPQMLASRNHPRARTHRELKEALYYDIILYFDKGKMWEKGIELCKELACQYESDTFDYARLSDILRKQAELYDSIMKNIRYEPQYFRVGYFGCGFASFLRNRVFIYRGKDYEKLSDFVSGLQNQFPNAVVMKTLNAPSEDVKNQQKQYLQVNVVTPVMELNRYLVDKRLSEQILKYYKVNEVQKFTYSRKKDESVSDLANMWLEKTILVTTFPLPGILRWFPVTSTDVYQVSPLEVAVEVLDETNQKIRSLVDQQLANPSCRVDQLGMVLNGVVDAAVNGGISNYKVFYSPEYLKVHTAPEEVELVQRLRHNTTLQLMILTRALDTHKRNAPESLQPFQNHMEQRFNQMKTVLEKEYGIKLVEEDLLNQKDDISSGPSSYHSSSSLSSTSAAVKRVQSMPAARYAQMQANSYGTSDGGSLRTSQISVTASTSSVNHSDGSRDSWAAEGRGYDGGGANRITTADITKSLSKAASSAASVITNQLLGNHESSRDAAQRSSVVSSRGSTHSSGGSVTPATSKSDVRAAEGVIELNQELTPLRPRRPDMNESHSRPTSSDHSKPYNPPRPFTMQATASPLSNSRLGGADAHMGDNGDPPPLPEKTMVADTANMGSKNVSTDSKEPTGKSQPGPPTILRRLTNKPQPPAPTTTGKPLPPRHPQPLPAGHDAPPPS